MVKFIKKQILNSILIFSCIILLPHKTADACFSVETGQTDINVVLPIAELQGLIQQLQDAGNQVVGEAGVQIRQSIDLLSEQVAQRIDQLKNAGSQLIQEASVELRAIIDDLMKQAKQLLKEVDNMIKSNIKCIDYVLAQRIQQILDGAYDIIDKVDVTIKNAVDRIYFRASMLVDQGTSRVAIVVNKTILLVVKGIILILCFILLFWLIKTLYQQNKPKSKLVAIGIPVFVVLVIAGGVFLMVSKTALGSMLGEKVEVPNWQNSCNEGDNLYSHFIEMKNNGASLENLKAAGKNALEQLNWCMYATISPEIANESSNKIAEINAIIFPVSIPPAIPPHGVQSNPCNPQGGGFSINPDWLSKFNIKRINAWNDMISSKKLINQNKYDLEKYRINLSKINNQAEMPVAHPSAIQDYKFQNEKMNNVVRKKLM